MWKISVKGRLCFLAVIAVILVLTLQCVANELEESTVKDSVFRVDDYGANPNSHVDSGPGIRTAIQAAIKRGEGSVVAFSEGTYYIDVDSSNSVHLDVSSAQGIVIDGNNAELIFRNPAAGGIRVTNSSNCVIRNMTIDYDPVPFVQGRVESVSGNTFRFRIDEGYAELDEPWLLAAKRGSFGSQVRGFAMQRERETGRVKEGAPSFFLFTDWEKVVDSVYNVEYSGTRVSVGDDIVFVPRYGGGAIFLFSSSNITIENVTVYAAPTAAVVSQESDSPTVRNLTVCPRPGTDRINSTNADGVHIQSSRGGPVIENCYFSGMADDGINIYTRPHIVYHVENEREIIMGEGPPVQIGDELEIIDPKKGILRGVVKVESLTPYGTSSYGVVFDKPVQGIVPGLDYRECDHVYNRSSCGEGFIIRNNVFENYRGRGVLIRSGNGIIEGNVFRGLTSIGISIANEPDWPEGPMSRDIVIRDNLFEDVGGTDGRAIQVIAVQLGHSLAASRGQRNISIENNTINNWAQNAIYVGGASGVKIHGNYIGNSTGPNMFNPNLQNIIPIRLDNVEFVTVSDTVLDTTKNLRCAVVIGRLSDRKTVDVSDLDIRSRFKITPVVWE